MCCFRYIEDRFWSALLQELVWPRREGDEAGDRPSSVGLATENIDTLLGRRVLGVMGLPGEPPSQTDNRQISFHDDLVNIGIGVVKLQIGPREKLVQVGT